MVDQFYFHQDGSANGLFKTPCGFEIQLGKGRDGRFTMHTYFNGERVDLFGDPQYKLSAAGAKLLHQKIGELYGIEKKN